MTTLYGCLEIQRRNRRWQPRPLDAVEVEALRDLYEPELIYVLLGLLGRRRTTSDPQIHLLPTAGAQRVPRRQLTPLQQAMGARLTNRSWEDFVEQPAPTSLFRVSLAALLQLPWNRVCSYTVQMDADDRAHYTPRQRRVPEHYFAPGVSLNQGDTVGAPRPVTLRYRLCQFVPGLRECVLRWAQLGAPDRVRFVGWWHHDQER